MIEGINIRCNVGPFEVLRSPRLTLAFRRRVVASRAEIDLPDPDGSIRAGLAAEQPVRVRFGHRGEDGTWQDWSGTIRRSSRPDRMSCASRRWGGKRRCWIPPSPWPCTAKAPAPWPRACCRPPGWPWRGLRFPPSPCRTSYFPAVPWRGPSNSLPSRWSGASGMTFLGMPWARRGWSILVGRGRAGRRVCRPERGQPAHAQPRPGGHELCVGHAAAGADGEPHDPHPRRPAGFSALVMAQSVYHELGSDGNKTMIGYGKDEGWG